MFSRLSKVPIFSKEPRISTVSKFKRRSVLFPIATTLSLSLLLSGCNDSEPPAASAPESVQESVALESLTQKPPAQLSSSLILETQSSETLLKTDIKLGATELNSSQLEPSQLKPSTSEPIQTRDNLYDGIPLTVSNISQVTYDDGNTVGIRFSAPLDASKPFQSLIHVTSGSASWILSDDGLYLYMVNALPEHRYEVMVQKGLVAANGNTLESTTSKKVEIGAAPPALGFASDGNFLTKDLHSGLPVTVQNVNEVNVSFFKVKNSDSSLRNMLHWKKSSTTEDHYRLKNLEQFATHIWDGRITLNPEPNKRRTLNLPLSGIPQLSNNGVYVAVMTRPGKFDNPIATTWFSVTDVGLHVRKYKQSFDVYAQSLMTGKPLNNVAVKAIYYDNTIKIESAKTDKVGRVSFKKNRRYHDTIIARHGDSTTLLKINTPALDLSDFDTGQRPVMDEQLYIYGPRDLYRGGETVTFSALLRDADGEPLKDIPLRLTLTQPNGKKVKEAQWRTTAPGYYEFNHTLPADAQTGDWRLVARGHSGLASTYHFKVEDFMPERLKITWNPENLPDIQANVFTSQQPLAIELLGEYLYGAPASGNMLDTSYTLAANPHPFEQWKDFHFGDVKNTQWRQAFTMDQIALNNDGRISLTPSSRWGDTTIPLKLSVNASLFESGGRPVVRNHSVSIIPEKPLLGIRPLFKDRADTNSRAEFEVIRTDTQGNLLTSRDIELKLINRTETGYWRSSPQRGWYYENQRLDTTELTLAVNLKEAAPKRVSIPVTWGEFELQAKDLETGLVSSYYFKAGHRWYWSYQRNTSKPDKITMALDKEAYVAGDVAQLKITPPAAGETLILVESDRLLFSTQVSVPEGGTTVAIPVSDKWNQHDIYISAVHLQPANGDNKITATRAVGLLHLPLDRSARQFDITLDSKEKWRPEETVDVKINVSTKDNKLVKKAWVTLAAVDVGVLSISDFKTPDPFKFFFDQRRYQVDQVDMYQKLIELNDAKTGTIRFGGDADLTRGGDLARSEVKIVSLYSGLVDVIDGQATVPLEMPDFNGRLRLMAIAFDEDRFGMTEQEIIVAAPVVTQLSLPRFMGAGGDESMVALDITNLEGAGNLEAAGKTGNELALTVSLQANGPVHADTLEQSFTLKHKEKRTLLFPFRTSNEEGRIEFSATITGGDDINIQREWGLVSRYPYPALTFSKRERLLANDDHDLAVNQDELKDWIPETLKIKATLSNQINLGRNNQLEQLLRYPYGCLEQTISGSYPWLYATDDDLTSLNFRKAKPSNRLSAINSGLSRIAQRQQSTGGFGLWGRDGEHEEHWLTAYAGNFFLDAMDKGYTVSDTLLKNTLKRLREYTRSKANLRERWSREPELYRFSYRAYAHYVLARHKMATLADIRAMAAEVPQSAKALSVLHLALAAKLQGDNNLADTLYRQSIKSEERKPAYMADYGSPIRDLAQQAALLWQHDFDPLRAEALTEKVEALLHKRRYMSTQERIALLQLSEQQQAHLSGDWKALITLNPDLPNADAIPYSGTHSKSVLFRGEKLVNGLSVTNQADDTLYASMRYQGVSKEPLPESSEGGVSIDRYFWTTEGAPLASSREALELITGDLILVELVIYSDERRPDLLVVDLLPAGLEIENQNLNHAIKLDDIKLQGSDGDLKAVGDLRSKYGIRHEEFRDDRFVAAIESGNDFSRNSRGTHLFYLARAVTPGTYNVPNPMLEDMYDPEARAVGHTVKQLIVRQP